ncbi:MAG: tRNA (guanosine(46)-N7)-methyltransferase TrmB [Lautropia sp. SCN 69-89]|nr:MAG: tRNA (guanosine(46)-N7)-methyltransferase TrmB [Lautropia sp. SCN 69-89]
MSAEAHPHIRSFSGRRGHFTAGQRLAYETLRERWCLPYRGEPIDAQAVFGREAPLVVEIGFGMGETTAQIAAADPERDFLGIEVYPAGVGSLLARIEAAGLRNLRIVQHDAVEVIRDMIAPGMLAGVHVYFPDPWPKKRHHKRRLIQPPFVALLASRLAPGGYLHCATDWEHYAVQMLDVLSREPLLANSAGETEVSETAAQCRGFAPRPPWRPLTKFESRGLRLGHGVWDLLFVRPSFTRP